ncbi:MAG: hypothetical protein ACQEQX_11235 [Thermodesulfobacteriota bacterium]
MKGLVDRLAVWKQKLFSSREKQLEEELVRLSRKDVAQRLIELEQEKHPEASRRKHIESAIWRLKKDRS